MNGLIAKAQVLVEALPYIRAFSGKFFVVKYGGHAMINEELKASVILDIVLMKFIGIKPILVHGGGNEINEVMERLGKKPRFVNGLRVTDQETMEIVEMVLMGKVNRQIVSLVNRYGGKAVGLSGKDANLLQARRRPPEEVDGEKVDLGLVGEITRVNTELLHIISDNSYIPVVSSIAVGPGGESLNINADHVAGKLATALQAEKLIVLTDVEGIYDRRSSEEEFVSRIRAKEAREWIASGRISGGMIPKVEACLEAVSSGVSRAHILDGRTPHSLLLEIFTDRGIGTMVTN
ncbi:MAG: acetylglutamate kinase [Firmicutes bacterium]|nr:acetylglutamate kinase [Bacillota bacterium]